MRRLIIRFLLALCVLSGPISRPIWAAFGSATIWEVQSSGSDSANGGGFDTGATFATDLAATSATGNSPVVTSASYNFVAGDANHYLFIKSGTNWTPGWYKIVSVASNAATLDASAGNVILYNSTTQLTGTNTAAGCATVASPSSGTWGVDYSRSNSARISYTDMVIDGTTNTKYTSAGNPVGPNIVGNIIDVTSGTGFTVQRVEVNSVSGTTATCDKSLGTLSSTGGNGGLGGALSTPGQASALAIAGNKVFLKQATYSLSSSSNVSGGRLTFSGGYMIGYSATRLLFNTDTRPILQSSANTMTCFTAGAATTLANLSFANGNANTSITAISGNHIQTNLLHVKVASVATGITQTVGVMVDVWCDSCGSTSFNPDSISGLYDCICTNGSGPGFNVGGDTVLDRCVAYNNAGQGFSVNNTDRWALAVNCVSYGNTGANGRGFDLRACSAVNCVAYGNAHYGFAGNSGGAIADGQVLINCAGGSNGTDGNVNPTASTFQVNGFVALTGDPFTNASGLNFALNNTTGAGAALRTAGYPASFQGLSTSSFPDIGAAQTKSTTGSTNVAY